jgi:DNA-binding transcriptional MocR family regulator
MLTGGASMTLVWLLLAFTQPKGYTRRIFMPSATFHLTFPTLRDVGYTLPSDVKSTGEAADVEGIREDSEGIDVEALERRLLELDAEEVHNSRAGRKIFRYALYLVPTFSNPTGIVLSAARRERLVQLAVRHDILIICDDVYDYLYYSESYKNRHPSRLSAVDKAFGQGQNVVSNGSFSKILAPGTRFGWLECHVGYVTCDIIAVAVHLLIMHSQPKLLQQILTNGALNSGGGPAHLSSRLVLPLLLPSALPILLPYLSQGSSSSSSGITAIERHISDIRLVYTDRLAAMLEAICVSLLPLGCSLPLGEPQGGYFLWMELPGDVPEDAFAKECEMEQVVVGLGSWFLVNVSSYTEKGEKAAVRFCWAFNDETRLREGIERVAQAIRVVQGVHLN